MRAGSFAKPAVGDRRCFSWRTLCSQLWQWTLITGAATRRSIKRKAGGRYAADLVLQLPPGPSAFIHTGLTRARGSMFTHFTPADLVAILNIPRLQTLPNSFKILREYRLSVVALVFSR